jgi:hypothetical protein
MSPEECERRLHLRTPALPWIAGYILSTEDLAASLEYLRMSGCEMELGREHARVRLPPEIGGYAFFAGEEAARNFVLDS